MAENGKKTATQGTAEAYEHVTGEETRNEAGKNAGGGSQRAVSGSIDGKTVKTEIVPGEAELLKKGKHAKTVLEYVHGCIDGTIIAGEDRILACERFLKFLERDDFEIRTPVPAGTVAEVLHLRDAGILPQGNERMRHA